MIRSTRAAAVLAGSTFILASCGFANRMESDPSSNVTQKEIAAFQDMDNHGNRFVTRVIEESKGEDRLIRVTVNSNGQVVESVHKLSGSSFSVEIPLGVEFDEPKEEAEAEKPPVEAAIPVDSATPAPGAGAGGDGVDLRENLENATRSMLDSDYSEALKEVNRALRINSRNTKALMMKGSILYVMGEPVKASEQYEKALAEEPDNREVRDFLTFIKNKGENPQGTLQKPGRP